MWLIVCQQWVTEVFMEQQIVDGAVEAVIAFHKALLWLLGFVIYLESGWLDKLHTTSQKYVPVIKYVGGNKE